VHHVVTCEFHGSSRRAARSLTLLGSLIPGLVNGYVSGVVNAALTIRNLGAGVSQTVVSNASGYSDVPNLVPGEYTVTVSAPGFATFVRSDVDLNVGSQLVINARLSPGQVNEKVEVTVDAPNVDLSGSSMGGTLRGAAVRTCL
jgi:hypothetical protein